MAVANHAQREHIRAKREMVLVNLVQIAEHPQRDPLLLSLVIAPLDTQEQIALSAQMDTMKKMDNVSRIAPLAVVEETKHVIQQLVNVNVPQGILEQTAPNVQVDII